MNQIKVYIVFGNNKMAINNNNQDNGNTQLNSLRNDFNDKLSKKFYLGNTKKVAWDSKRRNRTI